MKSNLLLLFILFFPVYLFSQGENDKIIYLDSTFRKTNMENHVYYRIVRDYNLEQESYKIEEFYKSGILKSSGTSSQNINYKYNGVVSTFYENKTLESETNYRDGQPDGNYFSCHPNGKKATEGEFILDEFSKYNQKILKIKQYWDSNGVQKVKDSNGILEEVNSDYYATGEIKNGLKNGNWNGLDRKLKISFSENFANGKFISGISTDKDSIKHSYNEVEQRPSPKKGINHFYTFVGKKFKSKTNGTGKIILSFIIEKNGEINEIEVLKGIDNELDKEAIRVLNLYSDWQPGKYRGINVRVLYSLPISIVQH